MKRNRNGAGGRIGLGLIGMMGALCAQTALAAGRLPTGVIPTHYDIQITPDSANMRFTGRATIRVQVKVPTRAITFNAADLAFDSIQLDGRKVSGVSLDAAAQTATVQLAKAVLPGEHRLTIAYRGIIHRSPAGLFAVDYPNEDGRQDRMLVTQFEAPDARRFAPMWDEPAAKARFTLSAITPADQTAISNMPVASRQPAGAGQVLWRFAETPEMSSYLLFFGMGHLDRKAIQVGPVEVAVVTRKGVADQGDYALESAKRVIEAFNDYFGTPYPLPKLDMIAVPGTSQTFSAMENWGAIFYFEPTLLLDPRFQTESQRQDVFRTVAHEIAHQWFGNLVTMAWWDDLWLNEGFASWLEGKATHELNPGWAALAQDVASSRQQVMRADALSSTHPIIRPIETVDQISQAFDNITYQKGQAVIRMLEGAVGPEAFRRGVRAYMRKYAYQNTVTDQLWAEIGEAAGRPVTEMMHSFTLQGGVPLVKMGASHCFEGRLYFPLSQGRFALDAASREPRQWTLAVPYGPAGAIAPPLSEGQHLVVTRPAGEGSVQLSGWKSAVASQAGCGPVLINPGQSGYFRTLYAETERARLAEAFGDLALVDQLGLLGDAYALANSGDQTIDGYFQLVDRLGLQTAPANPGLWGMVAGQFRMIDATLEEGPVRLAFRDRAIRVLSPAMQQLGWMAKADESPPAALAREQIIAILGGFGDPSVVAEGRAQVARAWGGQDVPGAVLIPALEVLAINADDADWDRLLARARMEKSPVMRQRLYQLLGQSRHPAVAARILPLLMSDEVDLPLRADMLSAYGFWHPAEAFAWATSHSAIVNQWVEDSARSRFITRLPYASASPALADRLAAYADQALPPEARGQAGEVVALIRYRAALGVRQKAAIARWAMARTTSSRSPTRARTQS